MSLAIAYCFFVFLTFTRETAAANAAERSAAREWALAYIKTNELVAGHT